MIKYYVNKAKRTVIAKFDVGDIEDEYYWSACISKEVFRTYRYIYPFQSTVEADFKAAMNRIGNKLFGVAKCSPVDEWDEEIGKALAKKRLLRKWNLARLTAFEHASNTLTTVLADINKKVYSLRLRLDKSKTQPGTEVNFYTN